MPIKVGCQCGQWFAAPDELAGTSVPCPTCAKPIAIGGARKAPAAAPRPAVQPAARPSAAAVVVTCACGQSYKAPETLRGQQLPCPSCGRSIPIPAGQTPARPAAAPTAFARPGGLDALGSSDPLADPLMSASLSGSPMAGLPASDPLGRPLPQYGQTLGRPNYAAAGDGPNWVIIGSIGGVAAVLLIMVIAIVATSFSGGGSTPVAAATVPTPNQNPPTTPAAPQAAPATPTAQASPATSTNTAAPTVSTTPTTPTAAPAAGTPPPGEFGSQPPVPGTPGIAGGPPGTGGIPVAAGMPPIPGATAGLPPPMGVGTPGAGGFGTGPVSVPGVGGPGGLAGGRPGAPAVGGTSQPGSGNTGTKTTDIVRIIPRNDPNSAFETPATVVPNVKGLATGLPIWHGDPKAKLIGVFKVGDVEKATNIQAHYSWMHNILPFIGHQATYDKFDLAKPLHDNVNFKFGAILIPEFLLPGDKRQRWEGYPFDEFALTHFVGMAGIEDSRNVVAGKLPRTDPRAGIFGYDKIAAMSEITDGTSSTIMVIGNGELANPWVMGGGATIRGARQPYFDKLTGFGSRGKGGPVAIMADGSIRMINTNVDPAVFRAMCTMHGADTVDLNAAAPTTTLE